jgi:uncharacterized protein (TIGR03437 family)
VVMRTMVMVFSLTTLSAAIALGQPTVGGIVNGGSYAVTSALVSQSTVTTDSVAQGAIFVIFGTNLGGASLAQPSGLPLPTTVANTSIAITSGGKTLPAYIVYTLSTQLAGILPSNTPVGPATVTVTYHGQTSAPFNFVVVPSGFGVITTNSQGTGPAIAQVYQSSTSFSYNSLNTDACLFSSSCSPAHPGDTLVIVGTGLGPISGADNVAPGAVSVGTNVTVNVGGQVITPLYAGRSPNFPGEDQVNFTLPASVPTGCYIPGEVSENGQPSNTFWLSIAPPGGATCSHPYALTAAQMSKLDAGGTLNQAALLMGHVTLSNGLSGEGFGGVFATLNGNGVFQSLITLGLFGAFPFPAPLNSCVTTDAIVTTATPTIPPNFSSYATKILDAGGGLSVAGPGGASGAALNEGATGYFNLFFPAIFTQGAWTITGTGGADVGPFSTVVNLPTTLNWTNSGNFSSVPLNTGLTITWTGGAVSASSTVQITGSSAIVDTANPANSIGKEFFCTVPASAGTFAVPASITSQLPASTTANANQVAYGTLSLTTGGLSSFTAPLTAGGNLDNGALGYGYGIGLAVTWH